MATLVVDIETVGKDWEAISPSVQQGLTKKICKTTKTDELKQHEISELKSRLGLSPFTGQIISLGMYDIERELGAVYFVSETPNESFNDNSFTYKARSEKELLEDFWEGARDYDTFVTFNGRSFLVPFIYHRSMMLKIKPSVEFARQRFLTSQTLPYQVDLLDEFTFYGAMRPRPSLDLLCEAYGVRYEPGLAGEDVADFFRKKKIRHITQRNAADVLAIKDLYDIWKQNLAPRSFLNNLEI